MEMTKNKVIDRLFSVLIVLFFATPFLIILYGQLQQQIVGIDIRTIIELNPYLNIIFITSFITPFIGLYMLHLKKEMDKDISKELWLIQLIVVSIGFLIMGNNTYGLFVSILVYFIILDWHIQVKSLFRFIRKNILNIKMWVAPFAVLLVSIGVRLMLTLVSNIK